MAKYNVFPLHTLYDAKLKIQAGVVLKICDTTPAISSINFRCTDIISVDLQPLFNGVCNIMYDVCQNLICIMQKLFFFQRWCEQMWYHAQNSLFLPKATNFIVINQIFCYFSQISCDFLNTKKKKNIFLNLKMSN